MIRHGEPKISVVKSNIDNSNTVYEISGLEKGISDAYASSLRMALLTHVPGLKPIGFEMMGVKNSQDRPSLIEQPVRTIIRNIEKIAVKPSEAGQYKDLYTITFDDSVEGDLTLGMFDLGELEAINEDLVILTSSEKHHVMMEIVISLHSGYIDADKDLQIGNQVFKSEDGFIRVDADFNPVTFVNFTTKENYPIEHKDSVLMEIKTNGTITTKEALTVASNILIKYFEPLAKLATVNWDVIPTSPVAKNVITEYDLPIEYLKFTPEEFNELKAQGAVAIRDLRKDQDSYTPETREAVIRELERIKLIDIEDNK